MAKETASGDIRTYILDQIESLRNEFNERREATPPPTSALQSAYEIRMQRLYDQLDATDATSAGIS